jgi:hypothetical protein
MTPRPLGSVAVLAPLVAASFAALPAQEPLPRPTGHALDVRQLLDKPHRLSAESGPPGTFVYLEVDLLPAETPLWLAMGAPRLGFEALSLALTNSQGQLRQQVAVPSWAGRDRSTRFIVFDAYFRPISMTRPFHVTAQDGSVLRQGQIGLKVGDCPTLVDEDGVAYALAEDYATLSVSQEVIVEGRLGAADGCGGLARLDVMRLYPRRRTP